MKKIFSVLTLIICCFFLTGCIDLKVSEELTLNPDSSIDHSVQLLASDNVIFMQKDVNEGFKKALRQRGMGNFTQAKEMNYFGIKGSNHISGYGNSGNLDATQCFDFNNQYFHLTDNSVDYFFFKYYDITVNVDVNAMFDNVDNEIVTLSEYKFTLNLPVKILNSNANNVYNNSQSATWLLARDGKNSIHVEFIVINFENIIIVGSVLIFLIIILIILLIVHITKRKKRKKRNLPRPKNIEQPQVKEQLQKVEHGEYCPNCGAKLQPDDAFCGECGKKLKE